MSSCTPITYSVQSDVESIAEFPSQMLSMEYDSQHLFESPVMMKSEMLNQHLSMPINNMILYSIINLIRIRICVVN